MNNIGQKADNLVAGVLLIGCTPSFLILIGIIALFRSCMGYGEIDIDNSTMLRRYMYDRINITDTMGNGYEILLYTTNAVSDKRYEEIKSRQHLRDSYKQLKAEAVDYFDNDLLNTDIYDFVEYAKRFDVDSCDVRLVNIWVYGSQYEALYQQPNTDFPLKIDQIDKIHNLGVLYLKENDVYPYNLTSPRTYRYWQCEATSLQDERYSHITEADQVRSRR